MRSLNSRVVWLWRLQGLLRLPFFWLPLAVATGLGLGGLAGVEIGSLVGGWVFSVGLLFALAWPSLTYEFFGFDLREDDLLLQSGVIFRRRSAIPHNRIQHVETRQGPVERVFGLSRVLVFTASGMSADGAIPGLLTKDAESLRDELSRLGGDDGV